MIRSTITLLALITATIGLSYQAKAQDTPDCPAWLNHDIGKLHSTKTLKLCDHVAGKPVLIVNTASHCGYTKQFSGLESLHQSYKEQGLVVIGFPSDSFNQEAKDEAETASVCYKNFGVTFLMSKPITVRGKNAHPIFHHLSSEAGSPSWNFNKYLIDATGKVVKRYESSTTPNSLTLKRDINAQFSL